MRLPCWTVRNLALQIEGLLIQEPMSAVALMEQLDVGRETVRRMLGALGDCIYVIRRDAPQPTVRVPIYAWRDGSDPLVELAKYAQRSRAEHNRKASKYLNRPLVVRPIAVVIPAKVEEDCMTYSLQPRRDPMTAMFFGAPS